MCSSRPGELVRAPGTLDPRGRDERVDAPEGVDGEPGRCDHGVGVGDVGRERDRAAAECVDRRAETCRVPVEAGDGRASATRRAATSGRCPTPHR